MLAGAVALAGFAITAALYPALADGAPLRLSLPWLPAYGVHFVLRLDGLAWMFCAMVTGIGFLVVLYARYYMSPRDPIPRFYALLLAFMGSMLGAVLSGNLVQMVFFWELTGLLSFLLIGYWHQNAAARDGARIALIVTSAGGLCLLGGVLLLGRIAGGYDLDVVLARGAQIRADPAYLPALILICIGALTKSAQFPFHFWLPHAMAAPTPVSAYLHSATLVKLGVFLLARLWPALAGTDEWIWIVGTTGLVTLVFGAYTAIFQHDLKGLLAYSTISHLGLVTVLLGMNSRLALVAALFHIMNHATFKASLFMTAGIIDHEAGTRDIRRLNGLYRFMPVTATLALVSAAAMAGVPLLNGFLSKEMFFSEALMVEGPVPALNRALPYVAVAWGVFSVAYSLRFIHGVFFGPRPEGLERTPAEPPRWMRFPMDLLVLACLLVGVLPGITVRPILDAAVAAVLGADAPAYSLAVWHGFTVPFMMSLAALGGGAADLMQAERDQTRLALARQVAERLDGDLRRLETAGQLLAATVAQRADWEEPDLERWMRVVLEQDERIFGMAVAFEPGQIVRRDDFCLYAFRGGTSISTKQLLPPDYVPIYREWAWYTKPITERRAVWSEPYVDVGGGNIPMVTLSSPIRRRDSPVGVLTFDLSVRYFDVLREWLEEVRLGGRSYGFVLSQSGVVISHPSSKYDLARASTGRAPSRVTDLGRDASFIEITKLIQQDRMGTASAVDPATGRPATFLFAPVRSAGWTFVAVVE